MVGSTQSTGIVTRACRLSGHESQQPSRPPIIHDRPTGHTRERELITQVVNRDNLTTVILGLNPTGDHSFVWLPKAC